MSTAIDVTTVDTLVTAVNELLPFPTELEADMGTEHDDHGTYWALQIFFGPIDPSSELRAHRAGIDAYDQDATWWIDLNHGEDQIISDLTADAGIADVAAWITTHAG